MKNQKVEYCYFCGKISTSKEHVPPKCIFPDKKDLPAFKDLRKNLIKIPSCSVHNLEKSKEDEYLMAALSLNILNNRTGTDHALTKVLRAFLHSKGLANKFFSKTYPPLLVEDIQSGQVGKAVGIEVNSDRLNSIFEHIARGVFFHHFGERLEKPVKIINEFIMTIDLNDMKKALEKNEELENARNLFNEFFCHEKRYGDNPEVFFYQIARDPTTAIIRLTFFEGDRVMCLIKFT